METQLLLALAGMGWYETRHNGELPTVVDGDSELDRLGALDTEELVALALAGFIALVDEQLE